jgi:hypothetical protein
MMVGTCPQAVPLPWAETHRDIQKALTSTQGIVGMGGTALPFSTQSDLLLLHSFQDPAWQQINWKLLLSCLWVRPDVCLVSIDDKVSVISRLSLLLGELSWFMAPHPGSPPALSCSLGLAIYLWQNLHLKLSPNSSEPHKPQMWMGAGTQG